MRKLSENFLNQLKNTDGLLFALSERVKKDHTLMLAIRDGYINIYYRGGNLLEIKEKSNNSFLVFFNTDYNKSNREVPVLPILIESKNDTELCVSAIPQLKEIMDFYFSDKEKAEREFQQLIARENNFSPISNESEYFITDIEFADNSVKARFDMLAVRWLASQRKDSTCCVPALIEIKYGDGALEGNSGLLKHLQDIDEFLSDKRKYSDLISTMEAQFNQLNELELLKTNISDRIKEFRLNTNEKPEVIIILANHNPRSSGLAKRLNEISEFEHSENFNLKFFLSSFAGYGLHKNNMFTLSEFIKIIDLFS